MGLEKKEKSGESMYALHHRRDQEAHSLSNSTTAYLNLQVIFRIARPVYISPKLKPDRDGDVQAMQSRSA